MTQIDDITILSIRLTEMHAYMNGLKDGLKLNGKDYEELDYDGAPRV
ncbi:MAG: hypothetical protein GY861_08280, partial [bacterium]|nr:hypothetical protein [bacterium]